LAQTQTGIAHCPISNMKLSSGVMRLSEMRKRGIPVGLAVDGSASNDGSSLLEELRVCYLLHRLTWGKEAPSGYEILKLATRGSARLLGRDDIGQLAIGKCADLFLVNRNRLELAAAYDDPKNLLATVGLGGPVDALIVGGKLCFHDGHFLDIDEAGLAQKANAVAARYLGR
jgi:cytosine/adenosine deaminase-related metal-dependent hydrolase